MKFEILRNMSAPAKLFFTLLIMVSCILLFFLIGLIVAIPFWGTEVITDQGFFSDFTNPERINAIKCFQVIQHIGMFVAPAFVMAWIFSDRISEYLYFNRKINPRSILLACLVILVANPAINKLGELNASLQLPEALSGVENWMRNAEENAKEITQSFLFVDGIDALLFNIFMLGFLPGLGEELLFRGVIQKYFGQLSKNIHWPIWITAAIFSALHFQFYGFLPRLVLGALFGYLLVWSGSIWLPIIAHFFNNSSAVVFYYYYNKGITNLDPELIGTGENQGLWITGSLLLSSIFIYAIFKTEQQKDS
ncbi:CPBP family intramembrane metalloprotease [Puteibacter caeruleilacunae]|nr:CPBP family intramembrane metalloprotease [Puteibacter caeruleilacunae]